MNIAPAATLFAALACLLATAAGSAAEPATRRAVWAEHELTIELQHLGKRYSCSELNQKIHDILAAIGARPNMRVEASRCGPDLDATQIAPWVHVSFSLPFEVSGERADFADVSAVERTVQIEPGRPASLDISDCQLLRQLELTLFTEVPMQAGTGHVRCGSNITQQAPFSISLDVLLPAPERPG